MLACVRHLEGASKPPPPAPTNWALEQEFACDCKHCEEAKQGLKANQQTLEMVNMFKRGSRQKLEHVAM